MQKYFMRNVVVLVVVTNLVPITGALKPQVTVAGDATLYLKPGQPFPEACQFANTDWIVKAVNIFFGATNFPIPLTSCTASNGADGINCSLTITADKIVSLIEGKTGVARCDVLGFTPSSSPMPGLAQSEFKPYTVLYPPANVTISIPMHENVGETLEVNCTSAETTWVDPKMFLLIPEMSYSKELNCTSVDGQDAGKIYMCSTQIKDFGSQFNQKKAFCEFQTTTELNETINSSIATISIAYPPTNITIETLLYSAEGQPINVTCKTTETTWSNPKMVLSISEISYSKKLLCNSISGTQGGKMYTCSGQISGIGPSFANKSALCAFQANGETKNSSVSPLSVIFRPSNVSIVTPLNVVEGETFSVTCLASETTWTNTIMSLSIPELFYTKKLTCTSSNGTFNGTKMYTCFNTISDLDRKFNKKSAYCVLLSSQGTKMSSAYEMNVSFPPSVVSIVSDSTVIMVEGSSFVAKCSLSESTWINPVVTFRAGNINLRLTSCTNFSGVNGGISYICSSTLDGSLVTESLNNGMASCSAQFNTNSKTFLYAKGKLIQVLNKPSSFYFNAIALGVAAAILLILVVVGGGLTAHIIKKRKTGFFRLN